MPSSYAPRHRAAVAAPPSRLRRPPGRLLGLSAVAAAATGLAVSSGVVLTGESAPERAIAATPASSSPVPGVDRAATAEVLEDRAPVRSRSVRRSVLHTAKTRALSPTRESGGQVSATEDLTTGDPRTVARRMLPRFGFGQEQFSCLDSLYMSESGWDVHADNPTSSAYGIPQALPGEKMSSAGGDWADNAATQIEWGLGYIRSRYGTPCQAWSFKQGNNWY